MPDSNPGPLPQKSGALPMSHHIYSMSHNIYANEPPHLRMSHHIYWMNCTRMIWRKGWIVPGWYEEKDEFIPFFKSSWCKIASAARNLVNSVPQTAATTFTFSSMNVPHLDVLEDVDQPGIHPVTWKTKDGTEPTPSCCLSSSPAHNF